MSMEIPPGTDLSQVPLLPNPDGSPPDFENGPSLEITTWVVSVIVMVASTVIGGLRLRTNLKVYNRLAIDDYCCICAWVLTIAFSIVVMTATSTARHAWDVPISALDAAWAKRSAALGTIYGPAMWLAKSAVLTMYLRLFNVVPWMRWACHFGIWFMFCAYWSLFIVALVYDYPYGNEEWGLQLVLDAVPAQLPFIVIGAISIVADVYILMLPMPVLWKLQVSWKRRIGLFVLFLTVGIGFAGSILVFYFRIVHYNETEADSTWSVAASFLACVVELNVAIMVSCTSALAASWRYVLRDSKIVTSIRSLFSLESLYFPSRATRTTEKGSEIRLSKTEWGNTQLTGNIGIERGSETYLVPIEIDLEGHNAKYYDRQ